MKWKIGDKVMVPADIAAIRDDGEFRLNFAGGDYVWVTEDAFASATLIERPLAVGDRAICEGEFVEILGIDGAFAWIKYFGVGTYSIATLSELRRAEERG